MFRCFLKQSSVNDLLSSELYNQDTFYKAFTCDLERSESEVIIESPFITLRRFRMLYPVLRRLRSRGVAVRIHTRHPYEHDEPMSEEAMEVISALQRVGLDVYYIGKLHRKLAIIDGRVLWEGSLNILSQWDSCEAMRRTESNTLAHQVLHFTRQLPRM